MPELKRVRLLLDENLSRKLVGRLADLYPGTVHVMDAGLQHSPDGDVWDYAREHGLLVVTSDSDFGNMAATKGAPPQVIWLRAGNLTTASVEKLLRKHALAVREFAGDDESLCLEIHG